MAVRYVPDFPPELPDEQLHVEMELEESDLAEIAAELVRRRPPGAPDEERVNERLTSLAEELGIEGQEGQVDYANLLRRVRVVGPTSASMQREEDLEDEEDGLGHAENARALGVENFGYIRNAGRPRYSGQPAGGIPTGREAFENIRNAGGPFYSGPPQAMAGGGIYNRRESFENRNPEVDRELARRIDAAQRRNRRETSVIEEDEAEGRRRAWWNVPP